MQRRDYMKTVGGIVGGTAVGAGGLAALTGGAAAADTQLEGVSPSAVETNDGSIKYVAFGGRVRFNWDGLDSDAAYGAYNIRTRIRDKQEGDWTGWANHGGDSGELGASWGGDNDYTDDTGKEGVFEFNFGSPHGQNDYAIAYNDEGDLDGQHPVEENWTADDFEADTDGGQKKTQVEVEVTCSVYDGNPGGSGSQLVEDVSTTRFIVTVNNEQSTATTGGEINGTVGT